MHGIEKNVVNNYCYDAKNLTYFVAKITDLI